MRRGRTDAQTCRVNNWPVGTRLVSGLTTIVLTSIGEELVLARDEETGVEHLWTLEHREWREAT